MCITDDSSVEEIRYIDRVKDRATGLLFKQLCQKR
jgi:hypothetical protein